MSHRLAESATLSPDTANCRSFGHRRSNSYATAASAALMLPCELQTRRVKPPPDSSFALCGLERGHPARPARPATPSKPAFRPARHSKSARLSPSFAASTGLQASLLAGSPYGLPGLGPGRWQFDGRRLADSANFKRMLAHATARARTSQSKVINSSTCAAENKLSGPCGVMSVKGDS